MAAGIGKLSPAHFARLKAQETFPSRSMATMLGLDMLTGRANTDEQLRCLVTKIAYSVDCDVCLTTQQTRGWNLFDYPGERKLPSCLLMKQCHFFASQ